MLIIPAQLSTYSSLKDRTLKIVFETLEPTPEQLTGIALNTQKFGYLAFKIDKFKQAEKDVLDSLESEYQDTGKSKGQRLRNVLFVYWRQDNKDFKSFEHYYDWKMENIIEHFKNKLES